MTLRSRRNAVRVLAVAATVLAAFARPVQAQATGSIQGRVTDAATTRPLNGAQVYIPGSNLGAITNATGEFVIRNVPAGSVTLRAEMLGYTAAQQSVTLNAGETARVDFALSMSVIELDAVVVTGTPGATQKRALGNTVTTISAAQVTEVAPINNVTSLLQGRSAGLTLITPSGSVGTAPNIRIRGASSYQASTSPVFYVDGIRIASGAQGGYSVNGQQTSALDAIDPEDIESIEVIKGPAAATLYGADAAAGVVQIITKKGRKGQQAIRWNARAEYGQLEWALDVPTNYNYCTNAMIANTATYPGCSGIDPSLPTVDRGRVITDSPLRQVLQTGDLLNYGLSAQGGGDRYSFFVSGDRTEEEGVFTNNNFKRSAARLNFTASPTDKVDISVSTQYSRTDTRLPLNDNASYGWLRNAYRGRPGDLSGGYAVGWRGLGPEQMAIYDNRTRAERFIIGATANYQPVSWFKNRLTLGLDAGTRLNTLFYPKNTFYGANTHNGYIAQYAPETRHWTLDYAGTISKAINEDITSDFSFGMDFKAYRFEAIEAWGQGLFSDNVRLVGTANQTFGSESFSEQRTLGFFVQEQVGWKNRVFLTGGLRMDNSSVFGSEINRIFYPKVQAAYVISEEDFFNVPNVDQLKIRAAWGRAGNAPDPFSADRTYAASTVILDSGDLVPVLRADAFGNPDLKAERGSEIEAGFDASFFEGRAGLELTYYNNTTYDALIGVPVPASSGFTGTVLANVGEINNNGIEITAFGTPVRTPSVVWDTRVTFSTNSNKLVSFGGVREEPIAVGYRSAQRHAEGYPLGGYWAEAIERNADGSPVLDGNGRPIIIADSMEYVGPSVPTREASITNTLTLFGNLKLYVFADYKGGHYMFNMTEQTRDRDDLNTKLAIEARNGLADPSEYNLKAYGGNRPYMEKADFIKLREVSLSYDLPNAWVNRFGMSGASVTVAGRNLAIWTKYSGLDPEVNIEGPATFTRADYMSVPMLRRIVTSVNVRF